MLACNIVSLDIFLFKGTDSRCMLFPKYCGKNKGTQKISIHFTYSKKCSAMEDCISTSLADSRIQKTGSARQSSPKEHVVQKSVTMKLRCFQCKWKHLAAGDHDILVSMILVRSNTWTVHWMTRESCLKVLWHFRHYSSAWQF